MKFLAFLCFVFAFVWQTYAGRSISLGSPSQSADFCLEATPDLILYRPSRRAAALKPDQYALVPLDDSSEEDDAPASFAFIRWNLTPLDGKIHIYTNLYKGADAKYSRIPGVHEKHLVLSGMLGAKTLGVKYISSTKSVLQGEPGFFVIFEIKSTVTNLAGNLSPTSVEYKLLWFSSATGDLKNGVKAGSSSPAQLGINVLPPDPVTKYLQTYTAALTRNHRNGHFVLFAANIEGALGRVALLKLVNPRNGNGLYDMELAGIQSAGVFGVAGLENGGFVALIRTGTAYSLRWYPATTVDGTLVPNKAAQPLDLPSSVRNVRLAAIYGGEYVAVTYEEKIRGGYRSVVITYQQDGTRNGAPAYIHSSPLPIIPFDGGFIVATPNTAKNYQQLTYYGVDGIILGTQNIGSLAPLRSFGAVEDHLLAAASLPSRALVATILEPCPS